MFRIDDKVTQLRNNYDKGAEGVFNDTVGVVTGMSPDDHTLTVRTDEDESVDYGFDELDELAHAYAVTIHRSQDSEYPAVVIPLTTSSWMMLQRNLLYTGVTRARKLVVLAGSRRAAAVRTRGAGRRHTGPPPASRPSALRLNRHSTESAWRCKTPRHGHRCLCCAHTGLEITAIAASPGSEDPGVRSDDVRGRAGGEPWFRAGGGTRDVTANFEVQKPAWRPWLPEQPTMSQVSMVKAERARQNRAYVRGLLTRRQPGFAAALASAEQHLSCQGAGLSRPLACGLCSTPLYGAVPGTVMHSAQDQGADHSRLRGVLKPCPMRA